MLFSLHNTFCDIISLYSNGCTFIHTRIQRVGVCMDTIVVSLLFAYNSILYLKAHTR